MEHQPSQLPRRERGASRSLGQGVAQVVELGLVAQQRHPLRSGELRRVQAQRDRLHPTDDLRSVTLLCYWGLSLGAGDALIGLNPAIDKERAQAYGIEEVPATVVEGARDYGVRFLGIPAGYEFSNLIDSIIAVSSGEAALTDDTKASLAALAGDVDIKVFSTPT